MKELDEVCLFWQRWVCKPEQEKFRGKELKIDEMWLFAKNYHENELKLLNIPPVVGSSIDSEKLARIEKKIDEVLGKL